MASEEDGSVHSRRSCRGFLGHRRLDTASRLRTDRGREARPGLQILELRKVFPMEYWPAKIPSAKKSGAFRTTRSDTRAAPRGAQEVEEVEEWKNRLVAYECGRFYPLLPSFPLLLPSP